jgi:aerobic-type carbon monoxide dehydrogenase small subunit (CoxS/CutS family)
VNGKVHRLDVPEDMALGRATRSCVLPVSAAAGQRVTTIEAIGETDAGLALKALSERHPKMIVKSGHQP